MNKKQIISILLTAMVLLMTCGCSSKTTQVKNFGDYQVEQVQIDVAFTVESLEDIYNYFSADGDSMFAENNSKDHSLVKLTVTGVGKNIYNEDTPALTSYTEVPVRIEEIYFAGEEIALTIGQELTVHDSYYVDPDTKVIISRLNATPLVNGHEFYALLYILPDNNYYAGDYVSVFSYPVEPYESFPEFANVQNLQNEGLRSALLETYENDVVSNQPVTE